MFSFFRRSAADNDGEPLESFQPTARFDYVLKMLGVDVADQRLGAHAHVHKPMTYFWRRVFDQKLAQAISNAYLLYARWAEVLLTQCKGELVNRGSSSSVGAGAGGETVEEARVSFCAGPGGATNGEDLSVAELAEFQTLLQKMVDMERIEWDRRLSTHLMSLCQVGNINSGARRTTPVVPSYNGRGAKRARVCIGGHCKPRAEDAKYKSTRTLGVCWCNVCSDNQGKARALHLCKTCKDIDAAHLTAAATVDTPAASGKTKAAYRPVEWQS